MPLGKAAVLLVTILKLLCKGMVSPAPTRPRVVTAAVNAATPHVKVDFSLPQTPKKVGAMWADAGLNWNDFLPEDQDMNKFVTEQVSSVTAGGGGGRRSGTPALWRKCSGSRGSDVIT